MKDRQGKYYYNDYNFENYNNIPPGSMHFLRADNEYIRLKNEIEREDEENI
jgi:hypothetical protein